MIEDLTQTGIGVVGDMPWGTHFCHFYETKADLLDTLVPYFKAGLDSNEYCLWVISKPLCEADATNALRMAVPGIDQHLSAGDLEIVSHRNWYLKNGGSGLQKVLDRWKDKVDEALAKGYAGIRVSGNTAWEAENPWTDFAAYERAVDGSIGDLRMKALCTYALSRCGAAQVLDVMSSHQFALVRRNGELEVVETSETRKARAEIERLNQDLEDRVLQRTRELAMANEELRRESIERERAEAELRRDITERQLAAEALREAEQKYRDIFENAGEGIFQTTRNGRFITANPAMARMLGFDSPEELVNARSEFTHTDYVEPGKREEFKRLLEENGFVRNFEYEVYRKDRSKIWISDGVRAVRDESGALLYFEGIAENITERKQAEIRSAAFATLARKLSGARSPADAARIIVDTADDLLGWDACTLDLYDADQDLVYPVLSIDTINGQRVDLMVSGAAEAPSLRARQVMDQGATLILREEPYEFDACSVPFGDISRPSASIMCVPMRRVSTVVGLLSIQSYTPRAYDDAALNDLQALADHCGEALNRIRVEEALRESEERLRLALDAAHMGTFDWDVPRDRTTWSRWHEDLWGFKHGEFRGTYEAFSERVHPDDLPGINADIARCIAAREPSVREFRVVWPDGSVHWMLSRGDFTFGDDGQPVRMHGVVVEITARRLAEEALRTSEERLRVGLNTAHISVFNQDLDLRYIWMYQPQLGNTSAQVMGHTDAELLPPEAAGQVMEIKRRVLESGLKEHAEVPVKVDGQTIVYDLVVEPLRDANRAIIGLTGASLDITDRKRAEQAQLASERKYRDIFTFAPVGIYQSLRNGTLITVNKALAEMLGYDSVDEFLKVNLADVYFTGDEREKLICEYEDRGYVSDLEFRWKKKDGSPIWVQLTAHAIKEPNGETEYFEGFVRDITKRKLQEEALHESEALLKESQRVAVLGHYVFDVATDFWTSSEVLDEIFGIDVAYTKNVEGWLDIVHPEQRDEMYAYLRDHVLKERNSFDREYRIVRINDSAVRWVHGLGKLEFDTEGQLARMFGVIQDITDRRQAEEDLIKQKEILQKIFDYTPMMITVISPDGRTRLVNREWERTLGWSMEEVTNGDLDIFAELYPDPASREEVLDCIAKGSAEWADFRTRVRDTRIIDTTWANVLLSDGTSIGIGKDITARKRAEAALRESEERYRDLVENSEELICTHDLQGRILSANRAAGAILGYQPQGYAGKKNLRDILAPEVRDQFDDYLARFQNEGFAKGLMLVQTSTGERRIWEYYNTLRTEGVATPIVRGMAHDITERKRAEKEREVISEVIESVSLTTNLDELLKLVHQSLKKVVYAENCLVALYDKETELFSQAFYVDERSECPPPQALGKSFTAYVFRTGLPYFRTEENFRKLMQQGEVELIGAPAQAWLGVPLKTPAETIGVLVVQHYERADAYNQRDLEFLCSVGAELALAIERKRVEAALRESEERYRELFENAKDAIYVHDLSGKYTSVNRAAEKLSGYLREEILGKNFAAFVAPEHLKQVREKIWKKLRDEGETSYEMDVIGKDGQRVPVEVSSRLIHDKGAIVGVQGMARDITDRKRAQDALRFYSRRLIEAQEEERQRIARELHDQIGQVLTAVQLNLHALQRVCDCPAASLHFEDSIKVLDEALDQVRDLSFDLRPSMLDDLGLIPALRWYVARQRRLTCVRAEVTSELPDQNVRFGRDLETACFRIAQEALTNVARHAQAQRVSVRLMRNETDLLVIIKDDGVGFDVDALRRRSPSAATLGLQGMRERAHAVGGTIDIDSAPSKGTEIRLRLPINASTTSLGTR